MEIRTIKPTIIKLITVKREAAYARVSVSKGENDSYN